MSLRQEKAQVLRLVCFLFYCLAFFDAAAAQEIGYGAAPAWVKKAPLPAPRDSRLNEIQNGVYYLVFDAQARIERDEYVYHRRTALKVMNRAGLEEAARFQFSFDPTEETFSIHSINILRDGSVIDRLDPSAILVARREADMGEGVTDGDLTAYFEIPDVRAGDIIDYDVSWRVRSNLWPGEFADTVSLRWSVPLEYRRARIIMPRDRKLTIRMRNIDAPPVVTEADGLREYLWEETDPQIVTSQDATPSTYANWGAVSVSTFPDWASVAASLTPAYNEGLDLPEDFTAREPWLTDRRSGNARITAAIRFVQDKVRYVADETGVGSHLPRKPAEVLARGWGDCKDKSLLLVAILRRIGVNASVALADLDAGDALPQMAPSPYAFDHAIVVVETREGDYWIDPTSYDQGGVFPDIAQPAYGYGLPLKKGSAELRKISPADADAPNKIVRETYDMAGFLETGVELRVESEYLGREADKFRRQLASGSPAKTAQDYLKYYQGRYPGLEATSDLDIKDERDSNRIVSIETYALDRAHYAGTDIEKNFPLRADAVLNVFTKVNLSRRTAPISLPYPTDFQHVITLENVGDFEGLSKLEKSADSFRYSRIETLEDGDVRFSYRLKTLAPETPLSAGAVYDEVTTDLEAWGQFDYNHALPGEALDAWDGGYILAFLALIAALVYLPFGVVFTFKQDNLRVGAAILHPVSLGKFIFLTIATCGLYALFWMWRNWRWVKSQEDAAIMPFWRSFFAVIWFFPLFAKIRDHAGESKPPVALGVAMTVMFAVLQIGSGIADKIYEDNTGVLAVSVAASLAGFLLFAPLVFWVNEINKASPQAIAANSRWTARTIGAFAIGAAYWGIVFVGLFGPE